MFSVQLYYVLRHFGSIKTASSVVAKGPNEPLPVS